MGRDIHESAGTTVYSYKETRSHGAAEQDARRHAYLVLEFTAVFWGLPTAYVLGWIHLDRMVLLWILSAACLGVLLCDFRFEKRRFWKISLWKRQVLRIALVLFLAVSLFGMYVAWQMPGLLFRLPREHPRLWALVLILYPTLSVYPQGIIYRAFLFHRYRTVFGDGWEMILVSALSFGYVHIVYMNPATVVLTLIGGLFFAKTYAETQSLMLSGIEHALYGSCLFTVGLWEILFSESII